MSDSDRIDVQKTAQLARIALTPEEEKLFPEQIGKILEHVRQLETLDLDEIEPTAHAALRDDVYRSDEDSWDGLDKDAALSNAPKEVGGEFGVPKVVE